MDSPVRKERKAAPVSLAYQESQGRWGHLVLWDLWEKWVCRDCQVFLDILDPKVKKAFRETMGPRA